jgi:hypothetical protein
MREPLAPRRKLRNLERKLHVSADDSRSWVEKTTRLQCSGNPYRLPKSGAEQGSTTAAESGGGDGGGAI